jgi:hypothetical protein
VCVIECVSVCGFECVWVQVANECVRVFVSVFCCVNYVVGICG